MIARVHSSILQGTRLRGGASGFAEATPDRSGFAEASDSAKAASDKSPDKSAGKSPLAEPSPRPPGGAG